jgi:hypothetical protein
MLNRLRDPALSLYIFAKREKSYGGKKGIDIVSIMEYNGIE